MPVEFLTLRLPPELKKRLVEAADHEATSLNKKAVELLDAALTYEEQGVEVTTNGVRAS